jgi:hypothetical protein
VHPKGEGNKQENSVVVYLMCALIYPSKPAKRTVCESEDLFVIVILLVDCN